ncbi:PAS domain-containing sensor histidine kinase [hot springs metagenome]|uniref:PAS domain-containing sensor histidine kinase n=1 Tax=hot springs metagenome TaxID=433727 RepID=A0A5J4L8B8_9ZZZZ
MPSLEELQKENLALKEANSRYASYIRDKVNQLLQVMGTLPLNPEELDDNTLLDFDPIGIVATAFAQVLDHLKETNRELIIARDELQAIFDATGVGISIIDMDFKIIKCNEKQRELLVDRDISDVEGKYCYNVYCSKESPGLDCPAIDTMATGRSVIIREVEKKGKHFQIVTTPFKDAEGNTVGVIEVLLDITEKKRAEDAEKMQRGFYLAEKSKLATIIESLSDGLFVTDKDGAIISFNNAASRITGYSVAEVAGLPYNKFFGMLSNSMPMIEMNKNTELNIQTKNGQQLILSITSALVKNSDGEEIGKVFTFRDITEEKQRQEIYHKTEKLVALGQLSAGIAHEMNTPLGSILGYARLLLKNKNLDDMQRERLEIIAEQAKRSSAIIKGLLNFARQSNPSLRNIKETNINDVLTGVLKLLQTEIEKYSINVLTDLEKLPPIRADVRQIEQAILNIILNAIQAVKDIRNNRSIQIKTSYRENLIYIIIRDNGKGIPEDIKSKIFDPFFTTKPVGEGTGLGLSISAGIISEHGGSIDVESIEGRGAEFIIKLPNAEA